MEGVFSYLSLLKVLKKKLYSQEDLEYIFQHFASHLSLIEFEFNC
jgi:hypothetical protein